MEECREHVPWNYRVRVSKHVSSKNHHIPPISQPSRHPDFLPRFHLYGPHGPTLLSNGPASVEVQGRWIVDAIQKAERENIKYIDPTPEATKEWKDRINYLSNISLFPTTKSTYMGGSLPGKAFEQVNYAGGIPAYVVEIREKLPGWKGFRVVK